MIKLKKKNKKIIKNGEKKTKDTHILCRAPLIPCNGFW